MHTERADRRNKRGKDKRGGVPAAAGGSQPADSKRAAAPPARPG